MRVEPGLLEREAESISIEKTVREIVHGNGGVLMVEGAAGIGKTRLLGEARAQAIKAGMALGQARASELERDFAFGMVRQIFAPLLAAADPAQAEELWQGPAAQAREVFAPADTDPAVGPAGDFAVLHGLYWLTANACQDRPLVLLMDDLQWCDIPSLRYLAYLLPRLQGMNLLVAAARRTGAPATDERLLQQIIADPAVSVLRPRVLSSEAAAVLLEQALSARVAPVFAAACQEASGGNPLLLCELARAIVIENMAASTDNAARVADLAPRSVTGLVEDRLARLAPTTVALARAVAVLGDRTELSITAALAGQGTAAALEAIDVLDSMEILRTHHDRARTFLSFVNPLVGKVVRDGIGPAELDAAHQHAVRLLTAAGADPERIAAHLLHTLPANDPGTVATLRAAAAAATHRGAPESAYTYLKRALAEPPVADQRLQVLMTAGRAALLIDVKAAAEHLQQAYDQSTDAALRADLAALLGIAYVSLLDPDRGLALQSEALTQLPAGDEDHRRHLHAIMLATATAYIPGRRDILARADDLRRLPHHDSSGGRLLDCAIACHDTFSLCDPSAARRAQHALADGSLIDQGAGDISLSNGIIVLLTAEDDTVMDSLNILIGQAHLHGSLLALAPTYAQRCWGLLHRGNLADAEHDARECMRLAALSAVGIGQLYAGPFLSEALAGQGRLDEAEQALAAIGVTTTAHPPGPAYFALEMLSCLQRMRGNHQAALSAAHQARDICEVYSIHNPAVVGWRTEATLALHSLGRTGEARELAAEDLGLARRWGASRPLGRALRVSGLVAGGRQGLQLLQEAVSVLEDSPAQLEHAKALTDLGAALREAGHRPAARTPLREALDLATRCGATPTVELARNELAAAGGRPRQTTLTGPDALTPSERSVAELAAQGVPNRQIAQRLFVTPKTVEVHLTAAYRKLEIANRTQLAHALAT
ncbi:AAA family ATPase [Streptomyces sp. NPDC085614]|uniref:helix-turn-helix transcriptional regulator n=1 Tax=Streptomyces sp. NPDC085614 TaxID=3365733 RepID=UPI0037D066D0